MTIEAPYSKYKKTNFKILIAALIGLAVWSAYDGYFSEGFRKQHTDSEGVADSTLVFNQKAPFCLVAAAVFFGVWFVKVKNKKITVEEK